MNFALISEGWLRNENTYGDAITIKVRLHQLITGKYSKFFDFPNYVPLESYLSSLIINNGTKYQIININLDDVDDDFAKVLTKVYCRLIFDFAKGLKQRGSIPFHIVVEEAHRYVQNDNDRFLLGYNIFERISKEGRKYGVLLGLISQRPSEMSDTCISQCMNFLIFKMNHPVDVEYIRKMVPNISDEIVEKQKSLQSGTCLGFGTAFRIPLIVKMEMPNPAPWSGNVDVVRIWNGRGDNDNYVDESEDAYSSQSSTPQMSNFEVNQSNHLVTDPREIPEMQTNYNAPVESSTSMNDILSNVTGGFNDLTLDDDDDFDDDDFEDSAMDNALFGAKNTKSKPVVQDITNQPTMINNNVGSAPKPLITLVDE